MMKRNLMIGLLVSACTSSTVSASDVFLDTGEDRVNDTVIFNFESLPEHSEVKLNFDLFLLDSWDGNNETYGLDVFGFKIDGAEQSWTFRNASQDLGDELNIDATWNTGNFNNINTYGEIDRHFVNYADGFTIAHTGNHLSLEFFGSGLLDIDDESWRVEKISLKAVSLLPEEDQAIFIEKLYLSALNRTASQDELASGLNAIQTDSGAKVVLDLLHSREFIDLQLSNSDYIHTLFEVLLDRSPDADELNAWMQKLESGKLRDMAVYGILRNQEFDYLVSSFGVTAFNGADKAVFQRKSFVQRFYQLVLEREPDIDGFNYWSSRLADGGEAAGDIAKGFFQSDEFINRQTSDSEFLDIAYRSFFNRDADLEGKQYWIDELSFGRDRLDIVNGFIGSQEFINLASSFGVGATGDATNNLPKIKGFVQRFYQLVLNRVPDTEGLNYWSAQLVDGTETGGGIARGFFQSAEFIKRQASDSDFLDIAYRSFFNRQADLGGKQYWTHELSLGVSQLDVINGFITSQEFIDLAHSFGIRAD